MPVGIVAVVLAALAVAYASTRVVIDSDYSAFLPAGASATQRAFMQELRDGVASRIVLVELSGPAPDAAAASRTLARALQASPAFAYVTNGGTAFGQGELALLARYRYVLSDAVETPGHFSREGLRAALDDRLEALGSSAGFLDKQFLASDPTGELRHLLVRMTPATAPQRLHGVWFDAAGTHALLLAETRAAGADLTGQEAAMNALRDAFAASHAGSDITMAYSSPGAMALASRTLIAADARTLSVAALVLVLAVLAWVYRSVPIVLLCFMPAAAGLLAGVIAVNAWFGSVHGITLAFGVTLLGEAVDYPSYLLTQVRGDAPMAAVKEKFGKTLRLAVLTTASGALALLGSGFPGLAQLGLMTLVGVLVAGAATWWVLPQWVPAHWAPALAARAAWRSPLARIPHRWRWPVVAVAAAILAAITWGRPWWDDDLAAMNPLPQSFKERDLRLRAAIGAPDARAMLLVSGGTREDALHASEELRPALEQLRGEGAIGGFDLVSDYLPDAAAQARRRSALPAAADLRQDLAAAMSGLPFRAGTFEPFLQDVEAARSAPALTADAYAGSALRLKVESLLRRDGDTWHVVVPLTGVKDAAALQAWLVRSGNRQVQWLDLRAEATAMMAEYRRQAVVSSLAGVALIGGLLVAGLASVRRAARVLAPVLLAVAGTAAILVAAGAPLTVFHFVALLLTLGIGVNYALVLERGIMASDAAADVWRTLAVVSATALCTFGLLAWSSAPVLRAIGVTVCVGVALSLMFGALLIEGRPARASTPLIMSPLPVAASTLVNACGAGRARVRRALHEDAGGLRRNDFAPAADLDTWIGRVAGLEDSPLPSALAHFDCRNHRLALLCLEQDGFGAAVRAACVRHGNDRVGVFVGTSTSGILATELGYRDHADAPGVTLSPPFYRYRHGMFALADMVRTRLRLAGPAMTVSTACSSSAKVFAQAARAIAAGVCDAAVVGGVDSLALSTLYGFHSLGLLSRQPCRPFDAQRDGISIGEAAGFALLDPAAESAIALVGYGESCDAYHMSSPHPEGAGAVMAMRDALARANLAPAAIDYVNLHGTASRANDEIEDLAVAAVLGAGATAGSTKGWTGHTLGAAGVTEALIALMALEDGWLPGTLNCAAVDPRMQCRIDAVSRPAVLRHAMSNSFGFGGNNCALIFGMRA